MLIFFAGRVDSQVLNRESVISGTCGSCVEEQGSHSPTTIKGTLREANRLRTIPEAIRCLLRKRPATINITMLSPRKLAALGSLAG